MRAIPVLLLAITACSRGGSAGGSVTAEWGGEQRGRLTVPASAVLCEESGLLVLEAIRADSGLALAFLLADSTALPSGTIPVVPPSAFDPVRPGVLAGFRAYTGVSVTGWEGTGGTVTVQPAGAVLSGQFELRLQQYDGADTLRLTGSLARVTVARDSAGCSQRIRRSF